MDSPDSPGWKDITGSPADQARQQSRRHLRESGKAHGRAILAGAILLPLGIILLLIGLANRYVPLTVLGVVFAATGLILLQLYTVRVFRLRHRGGGYYSIEESTAIANPMEESLNRERQQIADRGFEAFVEQEEKLQAKEATQPIKVRCLSCHALNDEQAYFCNGCGARLR